MSAREQIGNDRIRARYRLAGAEHPDRLAREIAVEQTVEIPPDCLSPELEERMVGRVEDVALLGDGEHEVVVSYPDEIVGNGFGQLVNLLYGNISMHRGIRLVGVEWPRSLLDRFRGPAFGVAGLRRMVGVESRPLVCAAVKPVGLSGGELAADAAAFARGGADFIKDDHSLDEQATLAPFRERVSRCQEAIEEANAAFGGHTRYVPNLSGSPPEIVEKAAWLAELGVSAVMVNTIVAGLPTVRWLAEESGLAIFGHPTQSGVFLQGDNGIAADVLFGRLFRLAGCDAVIFVNAGGRFAWTGERCDRIAAALRDEWGGVRPAFPVPAGGMDVHRAGDWARHYGRDVMLLIGGSLYQQRDLEKATADLVASATG